MDIFFCVPACAIGISLCAWLSTMKSMYTEPEILRIENVALVTKTGPNSKGSQNDDSSSLDISESRPQRPRRKPHLTRSFCARAAEFHRRRLLGVHHEYINGAVRPLQGTSTTTKTLFLSTEPATTSFIRDES